MLRPAWGPFGQYSLREFLPPTGNGHAKTTEPLVDLEEHDGFFRLYADMPGLALEDVELLVENGMLIISGRRPVCEGPRPKTVHKERRSANFFRQIAMGADVDPSAIEASYKGGVLEVILPRRQPAQPRQIPVAAKQVEAAPS